LTPEFSRSFLEGRCIDGVNNYSCICDPGYVGRNCDRDFDDCSSSPCNHGEARLLNKEKTKVQNYTKKRNRQNNSSNNDKKRRTSPFLGSILTVDINFLVHVI